MDMAHKGIRYLINQTASNGLLYALSSSGILEYCLLYFFNLITLDNINKFF